MRTLISISFIILMFSCTKEITSDSLNASSSDNAQTALTNTYLPLTKGTFWKYQIKTDNKPAETSRLTVLGIQKKINNKNYQTIQSVTGKDKDTVYYARDNHNYYVYTNEGLADDDEIKLEILFLKDNASVGDTWNESAGTANGFSLNCYGKIINTNTTVVFADTTYKNVIHSYIEIRKPFFFTYIVVNRQDFYTAKGIGIIKNTSDILLPTKSTTLTNVTSYSIK